MKTITNMNMKRKLRMTTRCLAIAAWGLLVPLVPACGDLNDALSIEHAGYLPDGELALFTVLGIEVIDPTGKTARHTIPFSNLPISRTEDAEHFALSADGTVAAASFPGASNGSTNSVVALFRMPTGQRIATVEIPNTHYESLDHDIIQIAVGPNGNLLFVSMHAGLASTAQGFDTLFRANVFDTTSGAALWPDVNLESPLGGGVFSADGAAVYTVSTMLEARNAMNGSVLFSVAPGGNIEGLALNGPDGAALEGVTSSYPGPCMPVDACSPSYPRWSTLDGSLIEELPAFPLTNGDATLPIGFDAFSCSLFNDLCAVGLTDFSVGNGQVQLKIWNGTRSSVWTVLPSAGTGNISLSPDGQFIASNGGDKVDVYRIDDGSLVATWALHGDIF